MIVCGYSSYTRFLDYEIFRRVSDQTDSVLMCDMSHISGLVAAKLVPTNPFDYCDIITTTMHKTLRGPRGALLFYRKSIKTNPNFEESVLNTIFPGYLGGPHNHTISALATALKEASLDNFVEYQKQVISNSKIFGECLMEKGYNLMSGGTENHMLLVGLNEKNIYGDQVYDLFDKVNITLNKYHTKGKSHLDRPDGVRVGTPPMTTRGCGENDFKQIADIFDEGIRVIQDFSVRDETISQFNNRMSKDGNLKKVLKQLKKKVSKFSEQFDFNFESTDI